MRRETISPIAAPLQGAPLRAAARAAAALAPAVILAAALACLIASCWAPYYDPAVSASVGFSDKLGDPLLSFGPVDGNGMFDSKEGLEFLPARPPGAPWDPVDGFLVQKGDDRMAVAFIEDSGGSYAFSSSSQGRPNYFGSYALLRSEAADASGNPQLVAIADHQQVQQYRYDRSMRSLTQTSIQNASTSASRVYGAGAVLYDGANDADRYVVLFLGGSQLLLSADSIGQALGSFSNLYAASLETGGRSIGSDCGVFLDTGGAYLYCSASGGPTLRWDAAGLPSGAPTDLRISDRITAVLSDGTLVAQDDLHIRAYAASGQRLFSALAGSIRLEHEVYCPGPSPQAGYYVFFSQVLCEGSGSSDSSKYYVKVWRRSLADFRKLGD